MYENAGKPTELTKIISPSPINSTTTMTYDELGRLWTSTDANGETTTYTYDSIDRMTEVKDPLDGVTEYTYDLRGNLKSG